MNYLLLAVSLLFVFNEHFPSAVGCILWLYVAFWGLLFVFVVLFLDNLGRCGRSTLRCI